MYDLNDNWRLKVRIPLQKKQKLEHNLQMIKFWKNRSKKKKKSISNSKD